VVLWVKARKAELGRVVRATIHIVEDAVERAELERSLPSRSKNSPYPMVVASSTAEAREKARAGFE
jgi:hypothetical protein